MGISNTAVKRAVDVDEETIACSTHVERASFADRIECPLVHVVRRSSTVDVDLTGDSDKESVLIAATQRIHGDRCRRTLMPHLNEVTVPGGNVDCIVSIDENAAWIRIDRVSVCKSACIGIPGSRWTESRLIVGRND